MNALKHCGIGLAVAALACFLTTSTRASLVIEQTGPPEVTGSWSVGWHAYGITFDEITGTIVSGGPFEIPGLTDDASVWTSGGNTIFATLSGAASSSVYYHTHFFGSLTDIPPVTLDFRVYDLGTLVGQESLQWTGSEFDVVPEAGTVFAGMLLLLPFGASTLRILRRNRAA